MQAAKEGKSGKTPPAVDNRRRNAGPQKKRAIEPVEGAQTGSGGLGYLEKPAKDTRRGGSRRGK
jgi:hypothetical protein